MVHFDFGQNWADYSQFAATPERVARARADFHRLVDGIELRGKTFLDIGFGQGFGLLSAMAQGARVLGCDINPKCGDVLQQNKSLFPELADRPIEFMIGSILDEKLIDQLRAHELYGSSGFDVVHSWGVLHHTGNMREAIKSAAALVRPGGHFIIALYNRHWSSLGWLCIKWVYCKSPSRVQQCIVTALYPVIWLAKLLVTRNNPLLKERGMDFYYDVVDWVGGYPYEYATIQEVEGACRELSMSLVRVSPPGVPTGCNEFVFTRRL